MTLSIMLIGGIILLVFIVVPLQEFRHILSRLRDKAPLADAASPAQRGFEVADRAEDRRS